MALVIAVDLVERASAGDPGAVDEIFALAWPYVLAYCRQRLGGYATGWHLAEDTAQETMLTVVSLLPGYRQADVPFPAFVYLMARRRIADVHRVRSRNREDLDGGHESLGLVRDPAESLEAAAITRDELRRALATVDRLLDRRSAVIVRMSAEGYSAEEIGRAVRMKAGAVRVAKHRALAELAAALYPPTVPAGA